MLRPTAVSVTPTDNYIISVKFDNGEEKKFDVKPYIKGDGMVGCVTLHILRRQKQMVILSSGRRGRTFARMSYIRLVMCERYWGLFPLIGQN